MDAKKKKPHLVQTEVIDQIPMACADELTAVEFIEAQRWGKTPCCVHCGSVSVYKMVDAKTGLRNKRFLWRCHDCKKQYTVRIGTVYEESRIQLRHWCYAFWRMATSKKGVAALEIMRHCQINYRSALFLLNRIRFATAPDAATMPKLIGTVEVDEVYIGGKPRKQMGMKKQYRTTEKTPVFVAVERKGNIRRRIVANVTGATLKVAMKEVIDNQARIMSDEAKAYRSAARDYSGGHLTVNHSMDEYARGEAHINTAESSNALVKRGIMGIYHNVSKEYLHRYLWQYDFLWNHRELNDGERVTKIMQAADGKRLMYKGPSANVS